MNALFQRKIQKKELTKEELFSKAGLDPNYDFFGELSSYPDEVWAGLSLERDALSDKIEETDKIAIVKKAIELGQNEAKSFIETKGNYRQWLEAEGVSIKKVTDQQKPPVVMLATYTGRSKTITLYQDSFKVVENMGGPSPDELEAITIAHECYHQLEDIHGDNKEYNYQLAYRLFKKNRTSNILQYNEIAAHSFSKTICDLNYWPSLIEVLLLTGHDPSAYRKFISRLESIKKRMAKN